jgi:hypothetical protein
MASREQNERTFGSWQELPGGGRRYTREYAGRAGGRARYIKEVDAAEQLFALRRKSTTEMAGLCQCMRSFPSI